jgi:hypothetical protein
MSQNFCVLSSSGVRRSFIATVAAAGVLFAAVPADAVCDAPHVAYKASKKKADVLATNLKSAWVQEGFTPSYSQSTRAEANASMSASVSVEADAVFASVRAEVGATVGKSWSKEDRWSYDGVKVPHGKEGRIVVYRESISFMVTKKRFRPPCDYVNVWTEKVNAPLTNGSMVIRMQLRKPRGGGLAANNDQFDEEIDIAVVKDK